MKEFLKKGRNLLLVFLLLDFLMVVLHLLFPLKTVFNLDFESNLPTVYQGSKLILVVCISFLILSLSYLRKGSIKKEWFWIFWAAMFFFLGVDEMGQVHENISIYMKEVLRGGAVSYEATLVDLGYVSTTWLPYYFAAFILATVVVVLAFKDLYRRNSKTIWYLIVGWVFFLGVPVIEYINTMPHIMFQEGYVVFMLVEEIFEMLGATLLLIFTYESLWDTLSSFRKSKKQ
jgi:hypothetical protein